MLNTFRTAVTGTVAAALLVAASLGAHAAPLEFTIFNDSVSDVDFVFVSPDYSDTWGDEILAGRTMEPGMQLDLDSDQFGNHCFFDIQVGNRYGETLEFWGVDLCRNDVVVQ